MSTLDGDAIHLRSLNPESDRQKVLAVPNRAGIRESRTEMVPLSMDEIFIDFIQTTEAGHA